MLSTFGTFARLNDTTTLSPSLPPCPHKHTLIARLLLATPHMSCCVYRQQKFSRRRDDLFQPRGIRYCSSTVRVITGSLSRATSAASATRSLVLSKSHRSQATALVCFLIPVRTVECEQDIRLVFGFSDLVMSTNGVHTTLQVESSAAVDCSHDMKTLGFAQN